MSPYLHGLHHHGHGSLQILKQMLSLDEVHSRGVLERAVAGDGVPDGDTMADSINL